MRGEANILLALDRLYYPSFSFSQKLVSAEILLDCSTNHELDENDDRQNASKFT